MATAAALLSAPVPCARVGRRDDPSWGHMGRTCPLRASAAEAAPSSSSSTHDDFSWRLLEGANIHARREHLRVALWPSTGDRAGPPPPKRSFLDIDEVGKFARDRGIKKSSLRLCYRELFRRVNHVRERPGRVRARHEAAER